MPLYPRSLPNLSNGRERRVTAPKYACSAAVQCCDVFVFVWIFTGRASVFGAAAFGAAALCAALCAMALLMFEMPLTSACAAVIADGPG
eukprot:3221573-Rhodomonas_salina.3